jgi:hypothetical protein
VTEGVVVLHERGGGANAVRADPVDEDELEHAGAQAQRVLAGLALLAGGGLAGRRFRLVEDARILQELDRDGQVVGVTLELDEGTHPELELAPEDVDALTAPGGFDVDGVAEELLRELLEQGFVDAV